MSALDDARAVLARSGYWSGPAASIRNALAALVAECEGERQRVLAAEWWAAHPLPEPPPRRHGDTGGRLLSDDEDPIPS